MDSKKCKICFKHKKITEFYFHNGYYCNQCKSCMIELRKISIFRLKQKGIEYLGKKCVKCGYDKYYGALHFHHVDGKDKDWTNLRKNSTWNVLKKELDKCILLCANCHAEIHQKQNQIEDVNQWIKRWKQFKETKKKKNVSNCLYCKKEFIKKRKTQKCCSTQCACKQKRIYKRPNDKELLSMVSKNGYSKTAEQIGCSANSVKKWISMIKKRKK